MGFSDESFTVYDHPMTLVFENRGRLAADALSSRPSRPGWRTARQGRG